MELNLRPERADDFREAECVVREAFWNRYSPGCTEHYLLHVMRDARAFVPELSIVAECGGRIVGHAVSMRGVLHGDDGTDYEVLTLGPLAVLPEYQQRGIGRQLIDRTRDTARTMGFRAVLLCGDPDYYRRRGFLPAEALGIRTADDMYAEALHVCELYDGALPCRGGRYAEDAAYEIDESAAEAFDGGFPCKEKIRGTQSQRRFDRLVALRRPARTNVFELNNE